MPARKKPLIQAPSDKTFWVNNGPILRNLADLANFLKIITPEQFSHHVGKKGNHFATWVKDILGDVTCARALLKTKTAKTAQLAVKRRLTTYNV